VSLDVSYVNETWLAVAIEKGNHGTTAPTNHWYLVVGKAVAAHIFEQRL
jgi:hypothetical protein